MLFCSLNNIILFYMDSNHLSPLRKGVVGVQFLLWLFGATVLVPYWSGSILLQLCLLPVSAHFFSSGNKRKVPIF